MGMSTGAADIFGVTGGVMEAALRTVYELITGRELPFPKLHVLPIEGFDTIKEAEIVFEDVLPDYSFLEGVAVKVAVTSGGKGAAQLMDQVKAGTSPYHFIEVMGLPGRMYRRWRTTESKTELYRRSSSISFGSDLSRRRKSRFEKITRESCCNESLQRISRNSERTSFARLAPHTLHTAWNMERIA